MLRQLYYSILPYRDLFVPFLVVSLLVVPCWLAFRLYRSRRSGHPFSFGRELLLLSFVVYLGGLAIATLPFSRNSRTRAEGVVEIQLRPNLAALACASADLPAGSPARGFCVRNARGNFLLFLPFGFLLPLVWPRLRFRGALQIAFALSLGIELTQFVTRALGSHRTVDVNDVILNVLGASIGLAIVFLLRLRPGARPAVQRA